MKFFDLESLASEQGGEYVLGLKDLHSDACYLIYGILQPHEDNRLIRPGTGYEEILCAVGGPLLLKIPGGNMLLEKGHAFHVKENDSFFIANPADEKVIYVLAGGKHSKP